MTFEEEVQELRKRVMFLFRKAKNGKKEHWKQVIAVVGFLDIPEYVRLGKEETLGYYYSYDAALLHAVAERIIPEKIAWHVLEWGIQGLLSQQEPQVIIEGYKQI